MATPTTETGSPAAEELRALTGRYRAVLRAEARREAARRELDDARTHLQQERTELWAAALAAREAGATMATIAAHLNVGVSRVSALLRKAAEGPPERR